MADKVKQKTLARRKILKAKWTTKIQEEGVI